MTLKRLIKPLLISCAFPLAFSANAEMNFMDKNNFIALSAGIDQPSIGNNNGNLNSAKTTYVGTVEVGRKFYDRVSLSLEYKYFSKTNFNISDVSSGSNKDTSSWSVRSDLFMANIAFDLIEGEKITPYLKTGVGFSKNKANDFITDSVSTSSNGAGTHNVWGNKTKNNFTWQVGAGLDFKTSDIITTNIAYNFVDRGKFDTSYNTAQKSTKYSNLQDHIFTFGVKFKF